MGWECSFGDKLGALVCINDKIKQEIYIQLLAEYILPFSHALPRMVP